MHHGRVFLPFAIACTLTVVAVAASELGPQGVSPGALDRLARINGGCPTFSWEATPGAQRYELVVYRLDASAVSRETVELSPDDEVLFTTISGRATGWTPESSGCFAPGERYVWFVRAVSDAETGEGSAWSEPRFFEVAAAPSAEQVRQALEVLQRWQAATGEGPRTLSAGSAAASDPVSGAVPDSGSGSGSGSDDPKSVPTATAAIRGSSPDTTGEVYGVVGISASPDGAGMAAGNTAGGADLVLDGSEDGETDLALYQWGFDRASSGIETLSLVNSVSGSLDLFVQGNVAADALVGDGAGITDVDAETLDGIDGASYATDAEAAALVAAHSASAAHDGRYFTEAELSTSGTANAVHWDNLGGVPAGFADGVDDDTQYTPGAGLIIDGREIRIDLSVFSTRLSTVDSSDFTGPFTSVTTGADGLGLIAFQKNSTLAVAHCDDAACSSAAITILDPSVGTGEYPSIAIGNDGFGLICYYDAVNTSLKVAHCLNTECSAADIATLDGVADAGEWTSIAVGFDGLGLISYHDDTAGTLNVAHCNDLECSSARITTLDDSSGFVGTHTSIAIGNDGRGIISYHDQSNGNLKFAHCSNLPCDSAYLATLDSVGDVGEYTSIAVGGDGFPIISYWDVTNNDLKVTHCSHVACFNSSSTTLDSAGWAGRYGTSITIGPDGRGLISYYDELATALKVARCVGATCSAVVTATVDNDGEVGRWSSITIGADGRGLISYWDQTNEDLEVAHLGIGVP